MKRLTILFPLFLGLGALAGCGKPASSDKITILASVYPEYDWISNVIGDSERFELSLLVDSGTDMHSFQPSIRDIERVCRADMFVYVGGQSDDWVPEALKNVTNPNQITLNLIDALGDKTREEEEKEGMEPEEEEEEGAIDEHVWLSLRNVSFFVDQIADKVCALDPQNASTYQANAKAYKASLSSLDAEFIDAVLAGNHHTMVFADRFPFLYFVKDYGIDYFAAFAGCSAESEASVATITFLAGKVDELGLRSIMIIDGSDGKLARTVRDSTKEKNQNILCFNSLQTTTLKSGTDYLSAMKQNLKVLKEALA